jgi:hypothetical protein
LPSQTFLLCTGGEGRSGHRPPLSLVLRQGRAADAHQQSCTVWSRVREPGATLNKATGVTWRAILSVTGWLPVGRRAPAFRPALALRRIPQQSIAHVRRCRLNSDRRTRFEARSYARDRALAFLHLHGRPHPSVLDPFGHLGGDGESIFGIDAVATIISPFVVESTMVAEPTSWAFEIVHYPALARSR